MAITEAEKIEAKLNGMALLSVDWTEEELATRIVSLLIMDKGLVNAWQRTIKLAITIVRRREELIRAKKKTLLTDDDINLMIDNAATCSQHRALLDDEAVRECLRSNVQILKWRNKEN